MATQQSTALILASVAVAAGGSKSAPVAAGVGTTQNLGGHHGAVVAARFTNGGTGPTANAAVTVYGSHDGNDWFEINTVYGDLIASSVQGQMVYVDPAIPYVRADAWGNTGQAVTVAIRVYFVTGVT